MKLTLTVFPKMRCILSSEEPISPGDYERINNLWREWHENPRESLLVISECKVVLQGQLELPNAADLLMETE